MKRKLKQNRREQIDREKQLYDAVDKVATDARANNWLK
jgi:hypothetical protein